MGALGVLYEAMGQKQMSNLAAGLEGMQCIASTRIEVRSVREMGGRDTERNQHKLRPCMADASASARLPVMGS